MRELRGDLEALLRALGEDGPYVLVGTSGGGFLMAGFAYAHPNDVVGGSRMTNLSDSCGGGVPSR
jgi:pimeloyl-ACP methyl ester carboxylesterase